MDDRGTAVGDRATDAGGGATEPARVDAAGCEGADDAEVLVDDADVVDDDAGSGVETPALPHPAASKATSASTAIFGDLTVGEARITP